MIPVIKWAERGAFSHYILIPRDYCRPAKHFRTVTTFRPEMAWKQLLLARSAASSQSLLQGESGLFTALAEWAAKQVKFVQGRAEHVWKPNILLPVEDPSRIRGSFELVQHVAYPMGSIKLLGIAFPGKIDELQACQVDTSMLSCARGDSSSTVMEGELFLDDVRMGMQAPSSVLISRFLNSRTIPILTHRLRIQSKRQPGTEWAPSSLSDA